MGSVHRALLVDHKEALEPIFAFEYNSLPFTRQHLLPNTDVYTRIGHQVVYNHGGGVLRLRSARGNRGVSGAEPQTITSI